ncbi:MAG: hypothetical protein MZV49_04365 [Rhodopseudomonas palustris]|nr:hypothetical protein [Rhodopseudomonas palustris]
MSAAPCFGWKPGSMRADLEDVLEAARRRPRRLLAEERAHAAATSSRCGERRVDDVDGAARRHRRGAAGHDPLGELIEDVRARRHSRLVVYNETLDDPVGMVHIRDLIALHDRKQGGPVRQGQAQASCRLPDSTSRRSTSSLPLSATKIVRVAVVSCRRSMPAIDLLAQDAGDAHSPRAGDR